MSVQKFSPSNNALAKSSVGLHMKDLAAYSNHQMRKSIRESPRKITLKFQVFLKSKAPDTYLYLSP